MITCVPDITIQKRDYNKDKLVILACDGIRDVVSNSDAVSYLMEIISKISSVDLNQDVNNLSSNNV